MTGRTARKKAGKPVKLTAVETRKYQRDLIATAADPVVANLDMIDRALTHLHALRGQHSDPREFRLGAQGLTDMIRRACDLIDGHRSLADLEGAARFTLASLCAAQANGSDYGNSALGQAIVKLTRATEE